MRFDKLTSKFQLALADAQSLAVGRDHQFIEPVHAMIALLDQEGGSMRHVLAKAGINVNQLRAGLGQLLDRMPQIEGTGGDIAMAAGFNIPLTKTLTMTPTICYSVPYGDLEDEKDGDQDKKAYGGIVMGYSF